MSFRIRALGSFLLLLCFGTAASIRSMAAENPGGFNIHWGESLGSTNDDQATSVAVDPLGRVHIAGHFQATTSLGGINLTNLGLFDAFTACYGPNGALLWARAAGGPNQDAALAVGADAEGNTFISGYYQRGALFAGTSVTNLGGNDAFVAKYNPAGSLLWVRVIGGTGDERGSGLAVDGEGNCFVVGNFARGALFGTTSITNHGDIDVFVAKYSPAGELLWAESAGGTGIDVGTGIAADPTGGVVICGYHADNAFFGETRLGSSGDVDLFVAKYSSDGHVAWARTAGGPEPDYATAVSVDSDATAWVTGTVRSAANFGSTNVAGLGIRTYVAKYSATGENAWVKISGGSDIKAVHVREGHALVVGQFLGTSTFGTNQLVSRGNFDAFVLRYTREGEIEWARGFGGTNFDGGFGVATDPQLGCVFCGRFSGGLSLDSVDLVSQGSADAFVAKLSPAPLFITEPHGITVPPGSDVSFSAAALGAEPLSFQWVRDEVGLLIDATNSTLKLLQVQPGASGLYSVIVSNPFASVTSAPAYLNVFGLPIPSVRLDGVPGSAFEVTNTASVTITMESGIEGTSMFYTLDGTPPSFASQPYLEPFQLGQSSSLRAILYDSNFASSQSPTIPITFRLTPPSVFADGRTGTNIAFTNIVSSQVSLLSPLAGSSLFYTLDGIATPTNWIAYGSEFVITQSVQVRTYATHPGMTGSTSGPVLINLYQAYPLEVVSNQDGSVIITPPGGLYAAGTTVQLSAQPERGWSFLRWEGDSTETRAQIFLTMDGPRKVQPVFGTVLTLANVGAGSIQVQPSAATYPRGAVIQASAVPGPGQFLALWGGVGRGNQNPFSFTINGPVPTLSALFSPLGPGLFSLAVVPVGRGSVDYLPRQAYYTNGSQVIISAQPRTGERFLIWRGDALSTETNLTVTLDRNLVISATFTDDGAAVLHESSFSQGLFSFRLLGETGRVYSVQTGNDFTNWSSFAVVTNHSGDEVITHRGGSDGNRYYRAVRN